LMGKKRVCCVILIAKRLFFKANLIDLNRRNQIESVSNP
jgi:hypothetical protein